ncbi:MAG: 23S rRNA (adenine(2503)-C(2))-methyltransferase [Candidatus Portnoybacteria bacterium RBG_13_41_18]|uniref:23S rRNA (Adenine(2503)-C(2))-methyltransferase n=1 Tax=Candidatus Portnoybacteria bacterium RBG_13_41_18 TaxID=1801991 RepID=A0A1G2F5X3_9BACT|nr:MAG: 23S rRNA (adenine(2503)-C(2))-methyltransferase [Candidatus Portnoybacteria bacterium RBG_13_41_18]
MKLTNLEKILSDQPAFRLQQAKQAVFVNLIENWSQATNLPPDLREKLNKECPLKIDAEFFVSDDKNTIKAILSLSDSDKIEAVLMRYALRQAQDKIGRNTVCVSSQIGCPLGCLFCATGKMRFKRNLETHEIVEQVVLFARLLKKERQRVDNVVFMGMGEPFLNYENVMAAIKILNNQKGGMSIGARHISISTVGIIEGIEKFSNEPLQVNLAISLHASNNKLRSRIVPMNKDFPIEKVFKSVEDYLKKTGRKVMFEYIMIKDLNDSPEQAKKLVTLIKKIKNGPCMVNLISYNASLDESRRATGIFDPSPQGIIKKFKDILHQAGIEVTQRFRFGQDIQGACGQLAGK